MKMFCNECLVTAYCTSVASDPIAELEFPQLSIKVCVGVLPSMILSVAYNHSSIHVAIVVIPDTIIFQVNCAHWW